MELGDGGQIVARVVVGNPMDCPSARIDGFARPMSLRSPVPTGLKPACEIIIPAAAKSASIGNQTLTLPRPNPARIVVVGDTGCRIKGDRVQDCNDPAKWPLQRVARRAAAEKPDLIIHVGDYLYREDRCPEDLKHLCGTTPSGDRWETWQADFFGPAAKLLAAAPWAFSRGNHEDCARAWKGWFYYLDPRPWNDRGCVPYSAPYLVALGDLQLFMLDSSAAIEKNPSETQVATYTAQLRSIRGGNVWIIDHHPFWGMKANPGGGRPDPLTTPLSEAWERAAPQGVSMVISGHTHLFELLSFDRKLPPQLIAGDGGTALSPAPAATVNGAVIRGASVVSATSRREFGYTVMTKFGEGWQLALKDPVDGVVVTCAIQGGRSSCEPGPKPR